MFGVFIVLFCFPCEASFVACVQGNVFYLVGVRGVFEPLLRGFLHGGGGGGAALYGGMASRQCVVVFWWTFVKWTQVLLKSRWQLSHGVELSPVT